MFFCGLWNVNKENTVFSSPLLRKQLQQYHKDLSACRNLRPAFHKEEKVYVSHREPGHGETIYYKHLITQNILILLTYKDHFYFGFYL